VRGRRRNERGGEEQGGREWSCVERKKKQARGELTGSRPATGDHVRGRKRRRRRRIGEAGQGNGRKKKNRKEKGVGVHACLS